MRRMTVVLAVLAMVLYFNSSLVFAAEEVAVEIAGKELANPPAVVKVNFTQKFSNTDIANADDEGMFFSVMAGICQRNDDFRSNGDKADLVFVWDIKFISEDSIGRRYTAEALVKRGDSTSIWHADYLCADTKKWLEWIKLNPIL